MQHLINKQVIELGLSPKINAFNLQQLVSNHYHNDVLPLLEQVFDELSNEDEILKIDHLEIDLGRFSESELQQNKWDQKILTEIKRQLYKKIIGLSSVNRISRESKALNDCRQWLFYMEKGYLPWNAIQTDKAWQQKTLEALATDVKAIAALRQLILENPNAIKRIVWQHDEVFLEKLVEILTARKQRNLPRAIVELQAMISAVYNLKRSSIFPKEIRQAIWGQVLVTAVGGNKAHSWQDMLAQIIPFYLPDIALIKEIITAGSSPAKLLLPLFKRLAQNPEVFEAKNLSELEVKYSIKTREKTKLMVFKKDPALRLPEEGLFVRNAGIVLIHSFLPALFSRLEWIKSRNFNHKISLQKALLLLHYIATGQGKAAEHLLVIPKVLCAWPVRMPVDKEIEISAKEQNEADKMLSAAIDTWAVLKNSSIAGLREGFLQRNGKLFTKNDKLYLQVENSPIDVLLDRLPWNLSIIKLSWMKEILRVEWR